MLPDTGLFISSVLCACHEQPTLLTFINPHSLPFPPLPFPSLLLSLPENPFLPPQIPLSHSFRLLQVLPPFPISLTTMLTVDRFQEHCTKLIDPNISAEARKDLAVEVRDSIELVHSQEYSTFLAHFLPAFSTILTSLTVPQCFDNNVHKTRAIILEILSRLPHTEVLRVRLFDVFNLAMNVLRRDNEENAATAIHVIFDLHKNFRSHLSDQVQPFLDFVRQLYESFGKTVEVLLLSKSAAPNPGNPQQRRMPIATQSFKLITECPLLVMFVFQLYPACIEPNIRQLRPLMVRAIELEVPLQSISHSSKSVYQELIAAQVKTVSFLAYLLKQNPDLMKGDMSIPRSVVKLLQACPGSSVLIRKELLVATRHILGSPFRQGFYDQIDLLLDERVLVGRGRLATETLRPLAYSFLAELVHCVRHNLSITQLEKIIFLFSTNVHDPRFSYTLQTSSVRLLMNLIEGILKANTGELSQRAAARELLIRILETMAAKYVTLGDQVPRLLKLVVDLRNSPDPIQSGNRLSEMPIGDPLKEIADFKTLLRTLTPGLKTVIWSAMNIRITEANIARASLAGGGQATTPDSVPGQHPSVNVTNVKKGLTERECEIVAQLLTAGQKCFRLYSRLEPANGSGSEGHGDSTRPSSLERTDVEASQMQDSSREQNSLYNPSTLICATAQEEKEIFDQFAQIFTVLDVGSFQDVFGLRMSDLFDHIVANPQAIAIPQHFLANSSMSKYFADILLNFLVDNLSLLDVPTSGSTEDSELAVRRTTALLRMFKILFASVSLFPANEPVLRLHLATIVQRSLKFAKKAEDSHAYLQMLRAFFKAITSGKHESQFDVLYRDFIPLVEPLFDGLLSLYSGPNNVGQRELISELCLMMPARPSTIFPYLEKQIKPIVWALEGERENPTYGLRTLEFWVDMLQPSYLDILLGRVEPDLTRALHKHLNPPDNDLARSSLRILGKLGSRSRQFSYPTVSNLSDERALSSHAILLTWPGGAQMPLEASKLIFLGIETVLEQRTSLLSRTRSSSIEHRAEMWNFLRACFSSFVPSSAREVDGNQTGITYRGSRDDVDMQDVSDWPKLSKKCRTKQADRAEDHLVTSLLSGLIACSELPDLSKAVRKRDGDRENVIGGVDPSTFVSGLCKYFAAIAVLQEQEKGKDNPRQMRLNIAANNCLSNPRRLSPTLFVTSIVRTLCFERDVHFKGALSCLKQYVDALVKYAGGDPLPQELSSVVPNSSPSKSTFPSNAPNINRSSDEPQAVIAAVDAKGTGGSTPAPTGSSPEVSNVGNDAMKESGLDRSIPVIGRGKSITQQGTTSSVHVDKVFCRNIADVVEQLCHCCHQRNWTAKRAGAFGLKAFIDRTPDSIMNTQFFRVFHHHILRSLIAIVKGPPELVSGAVLKVGRGLMFKMLSGTPISRGVNVEVAVPSSNMIKDIILRVGCELISDSASARDTAREALRRFAATNQLELMDLLKGNKDQLLRPLHARPLRQHPLPAQVSYVECFNFFLESGKGSLSGSLLASPLRENLLVECMVVLDLNSFDAVTEAEEGFRHKHAESKYDSKTTKLLLFLRRKILELLCNVSMYCSTQLQLPSHELLFRSMISCFFRSLQSGDDEIVMSAKKGLKQAISKHPKPKELLQQNLRPILGYLADYKKLSIPYLQGLSRVLELFSHWFNVNLGDKLLEHLQRWTEPEKFAYQNKWTPGTESKVGAAILDLFHLLPPAAVKFLPQIVQMVVKLETVLPVAGPGVAHLGLRSAKTASTSPYRAPLLRYCNQHAAIASKHFLSNLADDRIRQLFFVLLRASESEKLQKEIKESQALILSGINFPNDQSGCRAFFFICVIDLISRHSPEWLSSDKEIISKLTSYWNHGFEQLLSHQQIPVMLSRVEELECIGHILIRYCKHHPDDIAVLFELLSVFKVRTISDFYPVKDFLRSVVTEKGNFNTRKAILYQFLTLFHDKNASQERKTHALQCIVVPMITNHLDERRERHGISPPSDGDPSGGAPTGPGLKPVDDTEGKTSALVQKNSQPPAQTQTETQAQPQAQVPPPPISDNAGSAGDAMLADIPSAEDGPVSDTTGSVASESVNAGGGTRTSAGSIKKASSIPIVVDEVFDPALLQKIMKEILDQPDEVLRSYDEPLSAQLLHLATEMIRGMPRELERFRKELIKFGWGHLKREDSIAKQWAFVNVTRFFEAYQAPAKIILQVYVALLRVSQSERRELVQQALDILTPALPRRLVHKTADHRYPIWIRYTKKILLEEGHSIPNLVHIWQLIVRHPMLFYVARAQFVPIMANSLNKIGLFGAGVPENKRLALDLVDLIIKWEVNRRKGTSTSTGEGTEPEQQDPNSRKRAREAAASSEPSSADATPTPASGDAGEPPAKVRKGTDGQGIPLSVSPAKSSSAGRESDDFCPADASLEAILSFLVQIPFRPMDRRDGPLLTRRCFKLVDEVLRLWPHVNVRLHFIEKVINLQAQERIAALKAAANQSNDGAGDSKTAKSEALKMEKVDAARMKRGNAFKSSFLSSALALISTMTKRQGKGFVERNISALRAVVAPSITDGDVHSAIQFAGVLDLLLKIHPYDSVKDALHNSSKTTDVHPVASLSATMKGSANPQTTSASQAPASKTSDGYLTQVATLFNTVNVAIDASIRAVDPSKNLCGLITLKAFLREAPSVIVRYQEGVTKLMHRMIKDQMNSGYPASSAGITGGSGHIGTGNAQRSMGSREPQGTQTANHGVTRPTSTGDGTEQGAQQDGFKNSRLAVSDRGSQAAHEIQALKLCLSLLGRNVGTLEPGQRKTLFHLMCTLIDKLNQVDILLEIVLVVSGWVFWRPPHATDKCSQVMKDPLSAKEKSLFLGRMANFERISADRGEELMSSFLRLIVRVFGGDDQTEKRAELVQKLERSFMLGLKSSNKSLRDRFFRIYDDSVGTSLTCRLSFILAKQDWEHLADTLWLRHAVELLISPVQKDIIISATGNSSFFHELQRTFTPEKQDSAPSKALEDPQLLQFIEGKLSCASGVLVASLRHLLHLDSEFAFEVWVDLVPKAWMRLTDVERNPLERLWSSLLTKEYHQTQMRWPRNNVQALLKAIVKFRPLPQMSPEVIRHLGIRWNAWNTSLKYLELREAEIHSILKSSKDEISDSSKAKLGVELEDIADSEANIFEMLNERDYVAGVWRKRAVSTSTKKAMAFEQLGLYSEAQDVYSEAIALNVDAMIDIGQSNPPSKSESMFWEERWIDCSRKLCQWDILTEFSRTVVNSKLLHECMWRLPDWSGLKELLLRSPIQDGPELKLYQAYVQLQDNKLELADNFINQGYQKALERVCSLPETADLNSLSPTFVHFQQLVELQESSRVFGELNALSRQGGTGVNIDQKIETVKSILNCWRERVPSHTESLSVWNDVLTWRNHMHAVVVNVLEALKDAANAKVAAAQGPQTPTTATRPPGSNLLSQSAQVQAAAAIAQALPTQVLVMGVNETAWNVHRFAKTCRKQGFPEASLFALQKLYPFGTMDLFEYFVKTKETVRSYMAHPKGLDKSLENGLLELSRCNMDHFNARQKAQLFTIKSKLLSSLGHDKEASEALLQALNTSSDVGGPWLSWARQCDDKQKLISGLEQESSFSESGQAASKLQWVKELSSWREAAVNCYLQAVRFGSRSARPYLCRTLRLLTLDVHARSSCESPGASSAIKSGPLMSPNQSDTGESNGPQSAENVASDGSLKLSIRDGASKAVTGLCTVIPSWMWLPWVAQLLNSLCREEAFAVRPILMKIAESYPQALFLSLRTFMEERKVLDKPSRIIFKEVLKQGGPVVPTPHPGPSNTSLVRQVQHAKETFTRTNEKYQALKAALNDIEREVLATQGTPENNVVVSRRAQIKTELISTHRYLERCIQAYRVAQHRQAQASGQAKLAQRASASASQSTASESGRSEGLSNSEDGQRRDSAPGKRGSVGSQQVSTASKAGSNVSNDGNRKDADGLAEPATAFGHADAVMARLVKWYHGLYFEMERIGVELSFRMKPQREEHLFSLTSAILLRCCNSEMKLGREVAPSFISALGDVSRMCFNTGAETAEGASEQRLPPGVSDLKRAFERELAPQTAEDFPKDHEAFIARLRRWQNIFQRRVDALPDMVKLESISKHLLDVEDSNVEVFGQYADVTMTEPSPDKHVKIQRFGADVRVVFRPSSISRGIVIIGSDGREYDFVLDSNSSVNIHGAEERVALLFRLLNCCVFAKDAQCEQRRLRLNAPKSVGIAPRAKLTLTARDACLLAEGLNDFLEEKGKDADDAMVAFRKLSFDAHQRMMREWSEEGTRPDVIAARIEAYHAICESQVPPTVLRNWVEARMRSVGHMFLLQKRFAESLGSGSVVSYCLGIGARRPATLLFEQNSGALFNVHMRPLTSNEGVIESDEQVPFRLTRNLIELIGRFGMDGPYFGSMATTLHALWKQRDLFVSLVEFVMRDELVNWVSNNRVEGERTSRRDEFEMVEKNVSGSVERLKNRLGCNGKEGRILEASVAQELVDMVQGLIARARNVDNLARMEAGWQAWY